MSSVEQIPMLSMVPRLLGGKALECDMAELHRQAVANFPESTTRPALYSGLENLREGIAFMPWGQWIGGKFATGDSHPEAMHCLNLCNPDHWKAMPPADQEEFKDAMLTWCNREITQDICGCHSTFALFVPAEHPRYEKFITIINAWTRRYTEGYRWGFFSVPIPVEPAIEIEETTA